MLFEQGENKILFHYNYYSLDLTVQDIFVVMTLNYQNTMQNFS